MNLLTELKRRNVFRVALFYIVAAWVVIQVAETLLPVFDVPDTAIRVIVLILALGFPLAVAFAWIFELTAEGLKLDQNAQADPETKRETSTKLNWATLIAAVLAIGLLVADRMLPEPTRDATLPSAVADAEPAPADGSPSTELADPVADAASIAVLPFDSLSTDPEQGYFADGLTEEILNSLAALPELLVTARTSSFYYKDRDVPVDEIAERLGVAHILEGSVRRSDDRLRATAQLIRASDGFHLWSQTYDRSMDDIFAVQSDIANAVASALGILLDEEKRERMRAAGVRDPEAYALFARGYELFRQAHSGTLQIETLREANRYFDEAVERAPRFWVAHFHSADLFSHLLLDIGSGATKATGEDVNVTAIRSELESRLREAARVAPNETARDFIEISRVFTSENWTGLAQRLKRAYTHSEACGYDQWSILGAPFGLAAPAAEFSLRATRCNAIDESAWAQAARAALYADDTASALEITQRGLEIANIEGPVLAFGRLLSLLAAGRIQEARAAMPRLVPATRFPRITGEAILAAGAGDAETLAALRQEMEEDSGPVFESSGLTLSIAARGGDREAANRMAAEIDARPAGPLMLTSMIFNCLCGAPFDLEATPNLAARLAEAALEWPPTAPIDWPLKDW